MDVVFLVDISGSLEQTGYDLPVAFIQTVVEGLNFRFGRTRVAYVTFAKTPTIHFYLDTYNTNLDILNAVSIDDVPSGTPPRLPS